MDKYDIIDDNIRQLEQLEAEREYFESPEVRIAQYRQEYDSIVDNLYTVEGYEGNYKNKLDRMRRLEDLMKGERVKILRRTFKK